MHIEIASFKRRGRASVMQNRRMGMGWGRSVGVALLAAAVSVPASLAADMKPDVETKVKNAAVMVFTALSKREKGDTPAGSGSGFFINGTGLAMTNNHVVDPTHGKSKEESQHFHYTQGALSWTAITDSGTEDEKTWEAVVVYQNEAADQALIQVYDEDGEKALWPHYLKLLPESRLRDRMQVWALGFPGGDQNRRSRDKHPPVNITNGNVLESPRTPGGRIRMIYTDVVARPGNSGGPMVDRDGYLVGTVTLMKAPEGREDTGGAKYSSLVPAALTAEMVRNAFLLGKMANGTDASPFMEALTNVDGVVEIPEFRRRMDKDVLFYDDGDRIPGSVVDKEIKWESELGIVEVPTDGGAYVMSNGDQTSLFIEGGNRLVASKNNGTLKFAIDGGTANDIALKDVRVVAFRNSTRAAEPVRGKVVLLDTDFCHLKLQDIESSLKFKSRAGVIEVPVAEVLRFETDDRGRHVLELTRDRRMTGEFESGMIKGVIAATKTPVELDLSKAEWATVEIREVERIEAAGLGLVDSLASAPSEIREIAELLESDDPGDARQKLDPMLQSSHLRKVAASEKEQLILLDAIATLREGKASVAAKAFRKSTRAVDSNIAAYAQAAAMLLKRHDDFKFEGKPLSDRATFLAAGEAMAHEHLQIVRDALSGAKFAEHRSHGDYVKHISMVKKQEDYMNACGLFAGDAADNELVRVWKSAVDVCEREVGRIDKEIEEARESRSGRGNQRSRGGNRQVDELNKKREAVIETARSYAIKRRDYGFRIEDQDIHDMVIAGAVK